MIKIHGYYDQDEEFMGDDMDMLKVTKNIFLSHHFIIA